MGNEVFTACNTVVCEATRAGPDSHDRVDIHTHVGDRRMPTILHRESYRASECSPAGRLQHFVGDLNLGLHGPQPKWSFSEFDYIPGPNLFVYASAEKISSFDDVLPNEKSRAKPCAELSSWRISRLEGAWTNASMLHMRLLLTESIAWNLRYHLPVSLRFTTQWKLGYSSRTHGVSLHTFFRQSEMFDGPSVVIISSASGEIFGGFASSPWFPSGGHFYGDPTAFTFRVRKDEEQTLDVFTWNVTNDCFQFADNQGFGMGGGEDGPAWYITDNLMHGVSSRCPTFNNPMFTPHRDFIVADFEAWYFESDAWTGEKSMIREKGPWDDIMRNSGQDVARSLEYSERNDCSTNSDNWLISPESGGKPKGGSITMGQPVRPRRMSLTSLGTSSGKARERSNLLSSTSITLDQVAIARPRSQQFLPTG